MLNRNETGGVRFAISNNNILNYEIIVNNLAGTDKLTAAHLYVGDVVFNGLVVLNLEAFFTGNRVIRKSLIDSLRNSTNEIYFNVYSAEVSSSLVREQITISSELI